MLGEETRSDIPSGVELRNILHQDSRKVINRIAWSPDGRMFASARRDGFIQLWDIEAESVRYTLQGSFNYSIAWSPDGRILASSGIFSLFLWNVETGELYIKLKMPTKSNKCLTWSPDGKILAVGSDDGNIRLWDLVSNNLYSLFQGHNSDINSIAWSPNGGTLVSGSEDGTICFWKSGIEQPSWTFAKHSGSVHCVIWSPDGKTVASASSDKTIKIWMFEEKRLSVIIEGHTGPVVCVAFSYDGRLLASKSLDGTVRLWQPDTGKMVATINEAALSYGWYAGLAFHSNAHCLATLGEKDTIIRIWDLDIASLIGSESTIHYRSAKVILVGESGVGKTSLSLVLTNQPYVPPESTHGRVVHLFDTQKVNLDNGLKETHETLLWDLAGQRHYRLIHQMHLNEVVLALIVFDLHSDVDPSEQIAYWERILRLAEHTHKDSSSFIKKFLVGARKDWRRNTTQKRVNQIMSTLKIDGCFVTSAKEGIGITELAGAIKKAINWEALPKVSSIKLFQNVKEFIVVRKEHDGVLSIIGDLYLAFLDAQPEMANKLEMANNKEFRSQFEMCIDQIEAQGLIKKLSFGRFVLLKPELLDYYASALIDAVLYDEPDGLGNILEDKVRKADFHIPLENRLEDKELEKILLTAMVEHLQQHDLVLRESSDDGTYLVFPSLVTREFSDQINIGKKTVIFRFKGPILNIYATLVVHLSHSGFFKKHSIWKDTVIFTYFYEASQTKSGTCGIFLQNTGESIGELKLWFDKQENNEALFMHSLFEKSICTYLQSHALPGSVKRSYTFICVKCEEPFSERIIKRRRERGSSTIVCPVCDTVVSIGENNESTLSEDQFKTYNIDSAANDQRDHEISITTLYGSSQTKMMGEKYDVFLCYNSLDEVSMTKIREQLMARGLAPWFDKEDLRPGYLGQRQQEQQIENIKSAAVFVGKTGIGPWQQLQHETVLRSFVARNCSVIPVLLPEAPGKPELPRYLEGMTWIDFRKSPPKPYIPLPYTMPLNESYRPKSKDENPEVLLWARMVNADLNDEQKKFQPENQNVDQDQDPMDRLVRKITGERMNRPGILIVSLGESPIIVSSMYDLLTEREKLSIDRVVLLVSTDEEVLRAYDLVKEALTDIVELEIIALNFKDADSSQNARSFLHDLYKLLDKYEKLHDSVYLSLAGGRKSMVALMAWVVPFFTCVEKLYHVIDREEKHSSPELFRSAYYLNTLPSSIRSQLMHPKLDRLLLVTIPFERGQQIGKKLRVLLLSSLPDDYEEAEAFITSQTIVQQSDIPSLKVSKKVIAQFQDLCKQDGVKAQSVRNGLLEMSRLTKLQDYKIGDEAYSFKTTKFPRVTLRYFTGLKGPTRPVFYTLPANFDEQIEQIVICSLEEAGANGYKTLKEVVASPDFSVKDFSSMDMLPPVPSPAESVLIVPLGKSPMVATQLYTLLTEQEKHTIHEIVLIYPQRSTEIFSSAEFIEKALHKESNAHCQLVGIPGLEDITNKEECKKYQDSLEVEIDRVRREYPHCKIDLALSGGRKGMTAMTIFAAQKKNIPYVYHTLITDEQLGSNEKTSDEIEDETTYKNLTENMSLQEAYDRLFLRAYMTDKQYPYARFTLFKVPIFSTHGFIAANIEKGEATPVSSTQVLAANHASVITFGTPAKLGESKTELLNVDTGKVMPPEKIIAIPELKDGSIVLYYSYADKDLGLLKSLQAQLSVQRNSNLITTWYRDLIQPGKDEKAEQVKHLNSAHIILLLVSPYFLEFEHTNNEIKLAMQLHKTKGVIVIPIICRPTADWRHTVFGGLRPLPKTGKTIIDADGAERENLFKEVAESIRKIVEDLNAKQS